MKVFLDDIRQTPDDSWHPVKTVKEVIDLLLTGQVEHLSLDHDLGTEPFNGSSLTHWMLFQMKEDYEPRWWKSLQSIKLHTANPVGRKRMEWDIGMMEARLKRSLLVK